MKKLNEEIKRHRIWRGMSQYALAEKMQLSQQAIAKWESGASSPSVSDIPKLCSVLGISPNQLFGYDSDHRPGELPTEYLIQELKKRKKIVTVPSGTDIVILEK